MKRSRIAYRETTNRAGPFFNTAAALISLSPAMRLISNRALRDFAAVHPESHAPLQAWRRLVKHNAFANFSDLKRAFNSVDKVADYFVFNIAGNRYRVIAAIHFNTQSLYVRAVLTHRDHDK